MQLYPAIDIKNGHCVRLRQGQFQDSQTYSHSPVSVAKQWEESGATFIHLVDLDGALVGYGVNESVIKEIAQTVKVPVQVGGGIRSIKDIENKLNLGVNRVIIGTKAVEDPGFVKEAIHSFGADHIVVGIDAKDTASITRIQTIAKCLQDANTLEKTRNIVNDDSISTDTKSPSGENGSESTQPVGPGKVIVSGVNTDEGYGELISPNN